MPDTTPTADRLRAAAERALESLDDLIANTTDPGVEALGARHELGQALLNTSLAAPSAPAAPADRATARRDRYAAAMVLRDGHPAWPVRYEDDERDYRRRADAVMAVADAEQADLRAEMERRTLMLQASRDQVADLRRLADEAQPTETEEPAPLAVGDRYEYRTRARTVTITRLWDDKYSGDTVAFEWRGGMSRAALTTEMFHQLYQPATAATEEPQP